MPVWHGRSRASSRSTTPSENRSSITERSTSSSVMPVQPEITTSWAWYSSAGRPAAPALTRSGMSLLTSTTSCPSAARLSAHARIRESLSPVRNPSGSTDGSVWFNSTCRVPPPASPMGDRPVETTVLQPQVVEQTKGFAREPAEFVMMPLAFEFADHHERQHHPVFREAGHRPRIGEQHRGVQNVRAEGGLLRRGLRGATSGASGGRSVLRSREAPSPARHHAGVFLGGPVVPGVRAGHEAGCRPPRTEFLSHDQDLPCSRHLCRPHRHANADTPRTLAERGGACR